MKHRPFVLALFILGGLYVCSYVAMSAAGGYSYSQSGRVRYNAGQGLSVSDLVMWHPKWTWYQNEFVDVSGKISSRGNTLGYLYSPLIILDRKVIHKTLLVDDLFNQQSIMNTSEPAPPEGHGEAPRP